MVYFGVGEDGCWVGDQMWMNACHSNLQLHQQLGGDGWVYIETEWNEQTFSIIREFKVATLNLEWRTAGGFVKALQLFK